MNYKTTHRFALLALLLSACSLASGEDFDLTRITPVPDSQQIPIADFFRPLLMQAPTINPGGTRVAALVAGGEDKRNLMVYDLATPTQKPELLTSTDVTDVFKVDWLNDTRLIFGIRFYEMFDGGLIAADVGHLVDRYPLLQQVSPTLLAIPQNDRTRPLVALVPNTPNTGQQGEAVVVNTDIHTGHVINVHGVVVDSMADNEIKENNQLHIVKNYVGPTDGYDAGFLADKDGQLAFAFTGKDGVYSMYRRVDDHWEKCPVNLDDVDILGYGRTHDEVIVLGPRQEGKPRALQFMDAATGKLGDVLIQDKTYDFNGELFYQPGSHAILGARFERNGPVPVWFNDDYVKLQQVLDGRFPGLIVRLIGADEAGRMLLVETDSDRQPLEFFSVDLEKKSFGEISKSQPWLDPKRLMRTYPLTYKTSEGRQIDCYVTLPAGVSKQHPAPLVVLPPGLPQVDRNTYKMDRTRVTPEFDAVTQFFASRGFAVLRPNHRGSDGYGWMFPAEDQWEFGKMADDVARATRHVLATGLIDKDRVGILGLDQSGFSAYLAVAAAEADPTLFRAVAAYQGTYDWAKYLDTSKFNRYSNTNYGWLARHLNDDKKLEAMSVNHRLNGLRAAVLVGYQREAGDATAQSTALISDLDHAGVTHESLAIGGERSTIALLHNTVEFYSKAESFMAKYLNPTGAN